ncbi:MAG: winged helix DNA-binding domain-containing protein [Deltaproteobacteria bacterium]|nr:winged helix DNA-binding domain-containing protein [Deltaproteobacteria bacterium]MBW2414256.1 winged helix DNA-binding domain-containing protein [Deltaproteobacteria bacterium]
MGAPDRGLLALRSRRQGFATPLPRVSGYEELFRRLQPVSTGPYARPGSPPHLPGRTRFDDRRAADRLRADRTLVKGRFQGGSIGYVHRADLPLYANAFARPVARPSAPQRRVLDAVCTGGPLTPRQLKEETGLLNKQVMPALHRLQQAFLVYEDQVDESWERAWYEFAVEWSEVGLDDSRREADAATVLHRALHALVVATTEQLSDWSGWPAPRVAKRLARLEAEDAIRLRDDGHWVGTADVDPADEPPAEGVIMLHKQDFLVRAHASGLRERFGAEDVLQYLLIDGELRGVVHGHWRFAPYDVDDVRVELPARERARRRDEILAEVRAQYAPPRHEIVRYCGKTIARRRRRAAEAGA